MAGHYEHKSKSGVTRLEIILLIALVVASCIAGYAWFGRQVPAPTPAEEERKTITIVDSAGRYVTVPWPLKRIAALTSDSAQVSIALGMKDAIVGITKYAAGDPWAPNVTVIGSSFKPNIEAIIATEPDVVITYVRWPKPEALEEKLEPLGIKVIRLDLYKIDKLFTEVKLLGLLVNKTDRAEELVSYWEGIVETIKSRVKDIPAEERVRVYIEGYRDYVAAGPGSGWDELLKLAGGVNVFADSPVTYPKVSPEAVIEKNPDVIIKAVSASKFQPYGAVDPSPLVAIRAEIMARPGWSEIKAVKDGRVYVICSDMLHDTFGLVAELVYIAKTLYPDVFSDLDPVALHRQFLEDLLGVPYVGIWVYPTD